ncbi:hypothetical protein [Microbacterium suwonense]|uniref:Uncharacterized protein n=1 Tax=Microbacterium suwonense TaxID=683047 RepID=A0ABN6X5W3_9MICO|nr:hypothetical protein [Microbacterium suwonense]BDZ39984.1 hypothetical protein GCM10025863_25980 [Microbacterium suwonense]
MTGPMQTYPFDTRPLTDPVDSAAVREFWRTVRAQHPTSGRTIATIVIVAVVFVMVLAPMIGVFAVLASAATTGHLSGAFVLPVIVILLILGAGIPIAITSMRRKRVNAFRLSRFAAANGMVYEHQVADPPLPGMIFQSGHSRLASSLVRGYSPRFVEFGNYRYTTGSGKNSTTHRWGYVAVKLDVPLPNIVLDALGNNALGTNLPTSFSRDQRLSLEGDFDRYFTLYCPRGYETDALYLFTPDIMARFIDHAAQLDVEIVDDWMFLYMQRPASTTDAATWAWLFGTVGALMTKFDQWARWRDDRLREAQARTRTTPAAPLPAGVPAPASAQGFATAPGTASTAPGALPFAPPAGMLAPPPGVAPQGRRLKRGASWVTIIAVAVLLGFMFIPQLFGVLAGFLLR